MENKNNSQYHNMPLTLETRPDRHAHLTRSIFAVAMLGMALVSTHGAFYPADHILSAGEFSARVHADLHTHSDIGVPSDGIVADSRSLRMIKGIARSVA